MLLAFVLQLALVAYLYERQSEVMARSLSSLSSTCSSRKNLNFVTKYKFMQAYRTHSVVHNGQVIVQLPEGFENTDVEIIVLKMSGSNQVVSHKKGKFNKYCGVLKTGLAIEEIDAQLKLLRDEWERPIS